MKWSESHSVISNSLRPYGLYSPWNSPGQNTGVGSLSFSRESSQPSDQTQNSHMAGRFFTRWATREASQVPPNCPKILASVCCFLNTKYIICLYSAGLKGTCLQVTSPAWRLLLALAAWPGALTDSSFCASLLPLGLLGTTFTEATRPVMVEVEDQRPRHNPEPNTQGGTLFPGGLILCFPNCC